MLLELFKELLFYFGSDLIYFFQFLNNYGFFTAFIGTLLPRLFLFPFLGLSKFSTGFLFVAVWGMYEIETFCDLTEFGFVFVIFNSTVLLKADGWM